MKIVETVNVKIPIIVVTAAPYTLPASSFTDLRLNFPQWYKLYHTQIRMSSVYNSAKSTRQTA
jgi:hypothetical protein